MSQEAQWGIRVLPEQRAQVKSNRYRVTDVCVLGPETPREEIITHPPFLCLEILSKDDTMSDIMERVEEYLAMAVPYVWVVDPWRRRGYHYTTEGMREAKDGLLRTSNSDLVVPLASLLD
jgi:Uma2 family endonuclease